MNMDDIFSQFGDVFGDDIFGSFFGGRRGGGGNSRSHGIRGSNLRIKIKLTYEEIAKGVTNAGTSSSLTLNLPPSPTTNPSLPSLSASLPKI